MRLSKLIDGLGMASHAGQDPEINLLTDDSREAKPGALFVAMAGAKVDGARFLPDAFAKGVAAILTEPGSVKNLTVPQNIAVVTHPNPREILPELTARFYAPQPEIMVAVTGTDGKSSTAHFTRQLWEALGKKSASLGTIGVDGKAVPVAMRNALENTTPGVIALHRLLRGLANADITHGIMEASSHGLHQHRLDGVKFVAGAFTNLTRDHLDYHKDEDDYFEAKARLFSEVLPEGAGAVLPIEEKRFTALDALCRKRSMQVLTFGEQNGDIHYSDYAALSDGMEVTIHTPQDKRRVKLPLVGRFQALNILTSLGLVMASGANPREALAAVQTLTPVPGRLEGIAATQAGAQVYVDYAHTPAALAKVLTTLREHVSGRIICVFGCGGDRDRGKRPLMMQEACKAAEIVLVTDDNPRTEDAAAIRREVLSGRVPGAEVQEIAGREEAIYQAIKLAGKGDAVLLAGKGHEDYQIIGTEKRPFDEKAIVREAISGRTRGKAAG